MREYIVNLTNNLIGKHGFDLMFESMKARAKQDKEGSDWEREFVRWVAVTISSGDVREMSPKTLGKIVCSVEDHERPCHYQPPSFYGCTPDQYLRSLASSFLAWSILYRFIPHILVRNSEIPPYPPRPRKTEADYNPLSGNFGP